MATHIEISMWKRKTIPTGKGVVTREAYGRTYYFRTAHVGKVVELGSSYWGDGESSYWAMVWNTTKRKFEKVAYNHDRNVPSGWAEVDAPSTLLARWTAFKAKRAAEAAFAREKARQEQLRYEAEQYAKTPRRGSYVKVVKGRTLKVGTCGTVFWVGEDSLFGGSRAGLATDGGARVFIAMSNLEVVRQPAA